VQKPPAPATPADVARALSIDIKKAASLIGFADKLYVERMSERFSDLRVSERLKRTNPFLLRIRGITAVAQWAEVQVQSALYASEEEAVGHLLEQLALTCHPRARSPRFAADFDFEEVKGKVVRGFQVKMSWDCMPMSSRKNLSNTIRKVRADYAAEGIEFTGYFAPCYGRAKTSKMPGQEYVSLASREFWTEVGSGDANFDIKIGEVCARLCAHGRKKLIETLVPDLVIKLTKATLPILGDREGNLDYARLFRAINR
jgi:type II restriction endonuclease EcoO109I-like protein